MPPSHRPYRRLTLWRLAQGRVLALSALGVTLLGATVACGASRDPEASRWFTTATSSPIAAPYATTTTTSLPSPVYGRAPGIASVAPSAASRLSAIRDITWAAIAHPAEVAVYAEPGAAEPLTTLANPDPYGTQRVFLVQGDRGDGEWLPVFVPVRPNGTTGWVRASDVELTANSYRVWISLSAHTLRVTQGKAVVLEAPIGAGKESTPTPTGRFFAKELIQPPSPNGPYGAFVYGLSAFSETPGLENFAGGEGTIGIHGTNDLSSIGANVSHGCVRVTNEVITELARLLPLGTPVEIRP